LVWAFSSLDFIIIQALSIFFDLNPYFNTNKQARSYERLFDRVNTIEQPLLLMGDFNTSDRHYQYRRLSQLLTNSFERAGWGFGLSFPAAIPLVRIDHIFHSSHWDTRSVWTHKGVGSEQKLEVSPTETLREHTTVPRNRGNRCNSEKPAPRR
jgi:endonuclease/exonuclease/phosphatase (EEP) superfamily protein YafD